MRRTFSGSKSVVSFNLFLQQAPVVFAFGELFRQSCDLIV